MVRDLENSFSVFPGTLSQTVGVFSVERAAVSVLQSGKLPDPQSWCELLAASDLTGTQWVCFLRRVIGDLTTVKLVMQRHGLRL